MSETATKEKSEDYEAGYEHGREDGWHEGYDISDDELNAEYQRGFDDGLMSADWREAARNACDRMGLPLLEGVHVRYDAAERCFVFTDGEREVRI